MPSDDGPRWPRSAAHFPVPPLLDASEIRSRPLPRCAYIAISPGKTELTGHRYGHLMDMVERDARFDIVAVIVGDTLPRVQPLGGPVSAQVARGIGDEWIAAATPYHRRLTKPFEIWRHDDMLALPDTSCIRADLETTFSEGIFRGALNLDIDTFVSRDPARNTAEVRAASERFIKEEIAVDLAWARARGPFTHIYPGTLLNSYRVLAEHCGDLPDRLRGFGACAFLETRISGGGNSAKIRRGLIGPAFNPISGSSH